MSLGLAIFASVVLVLAVYHKQFRKILLYTIAVGAALSVIGLSGVYLYDHYETAKYEKHRQAVASCVERNKKNNGDIFDRIAATGKSLEEECESNTALMIPPRPAIAPEPQVVVIYGGDTLKIAEPGEAPNGQKVPEGSVPLLYLGRHQKFEVTCGTYRGNIDGSNKSFAPAIHGETITCE
jgi:hypothetical protein